MGMFLFIIGFLGGILFIVKLIIDIVKKKSKKLDFIGMAVCFALFVGGAMLASDGVNKEQVGGENIKPFEEKEKGNKAEETNLQEEADKKDTEEGQEIKEVIPDQSSVKKEVTWDDLKENIIGKSDKDFGEITKSSPTSVRNDKTGNWKKITIADSIDIEDYALSYSKINMKEKEIHFIVNFNYNTTTVIRDSGGLLDVEIREYEKKEEHDAGEIGSGMMLAEYIIYPDGDVEEVK